ncbi:hypothetical protein LX32DRAFT_684043 [Colletotrichum zoysiae]|uniref:Uncharacterized protein n=1 Tax=Colletotrichum zoysiae TaxID=1216348 RepID=A0AAD9HEF3_9PEZI|nr:hypothetical protein LX32DRAFT_684043 [Colletotrichum zoysiae]
MYAWDLPVWLRRAACLRHIPLPPSSSPGMYVQYRSCAAAALRLFMTPTCVAVVLTSFIALDSSFATGARGSYATFRPGEDIPGRRDVDMHGGDEDDDAVLSFSPIRRCIRYPRRNDGNDNIVIVKSSGRSATM